MATDAPDFYVLDVNNLANIVAGAISAAGVPPIDNPAPLYAFLGNSNIPAGGTFTTPNISTSKYQSISGLFVSYAPFGGVVGTVPYVRVTFRWSVASDGYDRQIIEDWTPPTHPFSSSIFYRNMYASPCWGDTLTIDVKNYDTQPSTFNLGLFGSYRQGQHLGLRGFYPDDYSNEIGGLGTDNIIYNASAASLAPGASTTPQLMNLYAGRVSISGSFPGESAPGAVQATILPQPQAILGNPSIIVGSRIIPGFLDPTELVLPRRVCQFKLVNNGLTTVANPTVMIVAEPKI